MRYTKDGKSMASATGYFRKFRIVDGQGFQRGFAPLWGSESLRACFQEIKANKAHWAALPAAVVQGLDDDNEWWPYKKVSEVLKET